MLRQAAEKTGDVVGDGTSTSTILAHAIFADGVRNVVAGASAIDLKRGLDRGCQGAVEALKALSRPVETRKEKAQVATISAHNDPAIGELVADAMEKVGGEGVITVEESKTTETVLEVVEGMQFDRGFLSPYFVTNAEKMEAVLEDAFVLLCDRKISALKDLMPLLEQVAKVGPAAAGRRRGRRGRGAGDADRQPAPRHAEELRRQGAGLRRSPQGDAAGHGDPDRRAGDLRGTGPQARERDAGAARPRQARRRRQGQHDHHRRRRRPQGASTAAIEQIRREIDKTTSDYDKEKLQERLAKLAGGVAVIRVGAPSEAEMKSKKEALDDAISATKAAVAEGIVPGGGLALLRCIDAVEQRGGAMRRRRAHRRADPEARAGSADAADRRELRGRRRRGRRADAGRHRATIGFDAARKEYVDLVEAGIIDPTKVVRIALENAVSVASVLLLTEATMTEIPEPRREPAMNPEMAM